MTDWALAYAIVFLTWGLYYYCTRKSVVALSVGISIFTASGVASAFTFVEEQRKTAFFALMVIAFSLSVLFALQFWCSQWNWFGDVKDSNLTEEEALIDTEEGKKKVKFPSADEKKFFPYGLIASISLLSAILFTIAFAFA